MEMTVEQKRALALANARARAAAVSPQAAQQEQQARSLKGMSDQELSAAAYEQPLPPPGVTIHTAQGDVLSKGDGTFAPTTPAEAQARAVREVNGRGGDVADSLASGLPIIGPFLGRMRAGVTALKPEMLGGGGDYASNLEQEQARAKTYAEDFPVESGAAKVAGALAGNIGPGMWAARAAGPVAAITRGVTGAGASSLPGAIFRGAGAGALQGGASGAGETRDLTNLPDAAKNTAMGAGMGAAVGGAIPAAIGGAGIVVDALRNRGSDALSSVSSTARDYALRQLSDPAKMATQRQALADLGPDAMLADVSPEWMGVARGAASQPGSRDTIVNPLLARDAGKNARMRGALADMGPEPIPSQIRQGIDDAQEAMRVDYGRPFENATAVDTSALANRLEADAINLRGPAQKAVQQVRKMLNVTGTNQLDPNPSTLFQTRQAIDGLLSTEADPKAIGALTNARQAIDAELTRTVPGIKPVDANFEQLALQKEGLQRGGQVLENGKTAIRPQELAQEITDAAQPNGVMVGPSAAPMRMRQGTLGELYRIVGTDSNDVAALNRVIKGEGDWNRAKLASLFGEDRANRLFQVLDAEKVFQTTAGRVTAGSDTAMASRFGNWLDEAGKAPAIPTDTTITGGLLRAGQKVLGMASQNRAEDNAARFASELGRLSVAQGADRDAIVQALLARGQRVNTLGQIYGGAGQAAAPTEAIAQVLRERLSGGGGRR